MPDPDGARRDRSISLERLIASLTALDSIGLWTAHYLALRLGKPDACPTTDLGLIALNRPAALVANARDADDLAKVVERSRGGDRVAGKRGSLTDLAVPQPQTTARNCSFCGGSQVESRTWFSAQPAI